jgi:predicted nucleic acid-binding protein
MDVINRPQLQNPVTRHIEEYIVFIDAICEIYESQKRFSLLTDYKDNCLVDLAWQSKSALISDDRHFAPLKRLDKPKVSLYSKTHFYHFLGW